MSSASSCITALNIKLEGRAGMQLGQACAALWKGHVTLLRNTQGTTKSFFRTGKLFVTKEAIEKGESLLDISERRKGLGWAGMQSFPLTGNGII